MQIYIETYEYENYVQFVLIIPYFEVDITNGNKPEFLRQLARNEILGGAFLVKEYTNTK